MLLVIGLLNLPGMLAQVDAAEDLWEKLGVARIEEKVKATDFTLENLDGAKVNLKDTRGKVVFLNFWATWCVPCLIEMPSMEKLHNEFKDKGFTMLAVNVREPKTRVVAFREKFKLSFPILLDPDGKLGLEYGVWSLPMTFFVDREGYIVGVAFGARDWASHDALQFISDLLDATPGS
jgi:peroxiredoxin